MRYLLFFCCCCVALAAGAQTETTLKTLSPYFQVNGGTPGLDALPLKNTRATVKIAGVIADVAVTQTYYNAGKKPLEAVYVFPGSVNAAVYGLTMQIGRRTIKAKIAERQQARADYEQAKSEGKRASLLEQERPNVFQMNVANIMPGDSISVTLRYTELLIPEEGIYEFVYPTVVGPRYINGSETDAAFAATPYLHAGEASPGQFDLQIHLATGVPLQEINCNTHRVKITHHNQSEAEVQLSPEEQQPGNRDFVLRYALRGNRIETGMLLYNDGQEQFFLCMAQPPKRLSEKEIPPREYIFVVDVSGSMNGFPLDVSKKLLRNLIGGLNDRDRFNVVLFAGTSALLSEQSLPANSENIEKALQLIDRQQGSGGTELSAALQRALALPRHTEGLSRSVVLITDGYIGLDRSCIDMVRNNLNQCNLFAFGIGSSVNRYLIEGVAHVGQGKPFVVTQDNEADAAAEKFRKYVAQPVLTNIIAKFDGFEGYDIEPTQIPDVMSDRPVIIIGKWRGAAKGSLRLEGFSGDQPMEWANAFDHLKNWVRGKGGNRRVAVSIEASNANIGEHNAALKYLWARERIRYLDDYQQAGSTPENIAAVTQLGLQYNLLTAYTSFLAIEEVIANDDPTNLHKIKQPQPMPAGVSDLAVGFDLGIEGMSSVPAPTHSLLWEITGGILLCIWMLYRKNKRILGVFPFFLLILGFNACRQQQPVTYCAGDSIAFMLGDDRGLKNPYFAHASTYFKFDSLEKTDFQVASCRNLSAVHDYLSSHRPQKGAWRRIHFVVHGNEWTGMRVAIDAQSPDRTNADMLTNALEKNVFPALPAGVFDDSTQIIVNGCCLGRDTALLTALSRAFGGIAVQSAPYLNIFEKTDHNPQKIRHYLANFHHTVFPVGIFPGNRLLAQQLAANYPTDTINWMMALCRHQPRFFGDAYVHYFAIPVKWTTLYASETQRPDCVTDAEKVDWVRKQPDLMSAIDNMKLRPDQFRWTLTQINTPDQKPAICAEGLAMIYGVMMPVRS